AQTTGPQEQALALALRQLRHRLLQTRKLLFFQQRAFRRSVIDSRVRLQIQRRAEAPMVALLPISGLIVCHPKHPAPNIVLGPAGGEVAMQAEERVLHYVLRFVEGKPEADQVTKQRLAQFSIQGSGLARAGRKARKWQ